ncbi:MAG TPA: GNAT family N-acetyltransferase [Sphingomonas sp.]|nr:GNAT family N-acetyltransferase [Sphingomonas sp.]
MTSPMPLDAFSRLPAAARAITLDGLSGLIDKVAAEAIETHRFLRFQWYAAALAAYGGEARTIVVEREGDPVIALPMIATGPRRLSMASVPGSYWPFRSFPMSITAEADQVALLLAELGRQVNALRVGPVYDGDPGLEALIAVARAGGWAVLDRFVADSYVLDMAGGTATGTWPRSSTLKKNRFHEKHLASHGALGWHFATGETLPAAFDAYAAIEEKSWIADHSDGGRDAKFTATGHGAFWRAAAADPALAAMMSGALLTIAETPVSFAFDINAGALRYAIANSYDQAFAKHSPGRVLDYRNLLRGLDRGIALVDWGAGDSGYKREIGAIKAQAIRDWLFVRPGIPAMIARLLAGRWRRSGNDGPPRDPASQA